jgi:hypothetical protein
MTFTLNQWLDAMEVRFAGTYTDFEAFVFEGTDAEVTPAMMARHWPPNLAIERIDTADACAQAENVQDARDHLQLELERVAAVSGNAIVIVDGLHLMPTLYPEGLLQPVFARLRTGGRVIVFVAPLPVTKHMPPAARLNDWRTIVKAGLGSPNADHLIIGGGA